MYKIENSKDLDITRLQLFFHRGVIYNNQTQNTDMLQIRIIPDMSNIEDPDNNLPYYAPFNPTTIIKGVSEKDSGKESKATQVWVLCTNDFKIGWVFSEANDQYEINEKNVRFPWTFNAFKNHILRQHISTSGWKYEELKVMFSNAPFVRNYDSGGTPETAVSLDVINVRTGERAIMLQSGTSITIMQKGIKLRAGSPDSSPSIIDITPEKIDMVANTISLWGRNSTSLGKHGMQVPGMLGAPTSVDGSPIVPLLDISI